MSHALRPGTGASAPTPATEQANDCRRSSVARPAAGVAHEVALDVEDLGLPAHVDTRPLQHRHQVLCELLLLLARLPDLADEKVAARSEALRGSWRYDVAATSSRTAKARAKSQRSETCARWDTRPGMPERGAVRTCRGLTNGLGPPSERARDCAEAAPKS